jgi:hypothetical protein
VSVWQAGNGRRRAEAMECMVKNFKRGFNGDYGVKLTPNKFNILCEVDCSAFGVGWSPEVSLDETVVNEVYRVIVKKKKTLTPRRLGKAKRLKLVFKNQSVLFI